MSNYIASQLPEPDRKIYLALEEFRCMSVFQLTEFIDLNEDISGPELLRVLTRLSIRELIGYDPNNGQLTFGRGTRYSPQAVDCVWAIIRHLKDNNDGGDIPLESVNISAASQAARPLYYVYYFNGKAYYIAGINSGEEARVHVLANYMRTVVGKNDTDAKIIIVTWDEKTSAKLPEIPDFDVMVATVKQTLKSGDKPDIKFDIKPHTSERIDINNG